ncbi:unnamed protein product [Paramecium sonneborni]|uniref:Uncharacterized protein n=1 Tax=Paramecium sonneborni TaxID=65129 RepID=A0A8S1LW05_9CILI|nr:unnamed protein product [Paramecium sonneborni]
MSYDISSQFIQFRKQISSKIKNSPLKNNNKIITPENSVDHLKKQLTNNLIRLKAKSTICNINLTPKRNLPVSKTNKLKSSFISKQNNTPKTPNKSLYYNTSKSQQSNINLFQQPNTLRQLDYLEQQNEIKQYSSKYYKIMNEEQSLYYSKLQTKLDQLSNVIGNQIDRQQNLNELDNMINFSKQKNANSKKEKYVDSLQYESKVLQNDILSIKSKLERFAEVKDN